MKPRTKARAVALQVLYETDLSGHPAVDVFKARLEDMAAEALEEERNKYPNKEPAEIQIPEKKLLNDELKEFARRIIFGVLPPQ